ncbi:MAG: hypothetical protein NT031_15155 [Planctomycetota bacterium]|nr:hypothetical protein [Planctomycetota bacterium]
MTIIGKGAPDARLSDRTGESIIAEAAEALAPDGRRILVLIPDHTRSPGCSTQTSLAGRRSWTS